MLGGLFFLEITDKIRSMNYSDQLAEIVSLPFDTETQIYSDGEIDIYVLRPSELSSRFKDYDAAKNFQIWIKIGERKFKPNHFRVMVDLYLRARSRPDIKRELAKAFDDIFYGAAPEEAIAQLANTNFVHYLNSLQITAYLSQLFLIEQAHGYKKESRYDPRTLFYQGWIRQVIDSDKEIDNVIMSIARGNTPGVGYTSGDDKNHKKHLDNPKSLWWLQ